MKTDTDPSLAYGQCASCRKSTRGSFFSFWFRVIDFYMVAAPARLPHLQLKVSLHIWLGDRKGIRPVKTWGGCGGGIAVSSIGVAPTWTVGASASIFFLCSTKIQKNDGVQQCYWA